MQAEWPSLNPLEEQRLSRLAAALLLGSRLAHKKSGNLAASALINKTAEKKGQLTP